MAGFNLLSNGDMIRTIYEFEKILFDIKSFRKVIFKANHGKSNINKTNNINEQILIQKNYEILFEKEIKL